jgi:hypothetical protein
MHPTQNDLVKILFRFHSSVLDEETSETLWAKTIDEKNGHYQLDNIPFYAPLVACDDVVWAVLDEREHMLTYRGTLLPSGNSTVQVVMMKKTEEAAAVRAVFSEMGCESEGMGNGYFVMCIPAWLNYAPVKLKLDQLSASGLLDYAEPLLSDNHRY